MMVGNHDKVAIMTRRFPSMKTTMMIVCLSIMISPSLSFYLSSSSSLLCKKEIMTKVTKTTVTKNFLVKEGEGPPSSTETPATTTPSPKQQQQQQASKSSLLSFVSISTIDSLWKQFPYAAAGLTW